MKKILLVVGALLFIFGIVDFGGSYAEFDLWGEIGIELPDIIWKYSAYIEMAIGAVLFGLGRDSDEE